MYRRSCTEYGNIIIRIPSVYWQMTRMKQVLWKSEYNAQRVTFKLFSSDTCYETHLKNSMQFLRKNECCLSEKLIQAEN